MLYRERRHCHALFWFQWLASVIGVIHFQETFNDGDGWKSRWHQSKWRSKHDHHGWFNITTKNMKPQGNAALEVIGTEQWHSIVAPFQSFSNVGKMLVIQYTVTVPWELVCANIDIQIGPKLKDYMKFGRHSPWHIKFGPYKCGHRHTRVVMDFRRGRKTFKPTTQIDYNMQQKNEPWVYRFVLYPDNSVLYTLDDTVVFKGSLEEDWSMVPPREIPDLNDTKPADWIDERYIPNPNSKKPHDWVDEARVPDENMKKPPHWDEAEDGPWKPMKANPAYRGVWKPKLSVNPDYSGEWKQRMVKNPKYKPNPDLYAFDDISYVGFELWSVRGGAVVDDIIICDTIEEANEAVRHWKAWADEQAERIMAEHKPPEVLEELWDDTSEVDDYDEDEDEIVPIMPNKPLRKEL